MENQNENSKTTFVTVNHISFTSATIFIAYSKTTFVTVNLQNGQTHQQQLLYSKTTFVTVNLLFLLCVYGNT